MFISVWFTAAKAPFWHESLHVKKHGPEHVPLHSVWSLLSIIYARTKPPITVVEELSHHELIRAKVVETRNDEKGNRTDCTEHSSEFRHYVHDAVDAAKVAVIAEGHFKSHSVLHHVFVAQCSTRLLLENERI